MTKPFVVEGCLACSYSQMAVTALADRDDLIGPTVGATDGEATGSPDRCAQSIFTERSEPAIVLAERGWL